MMRRDEEKRYKVVAMLYVCWYHNNNAVCERSNGHQQDALINFWKWHKISIVVASIGMLCERRIEIFENHKIDIKLLHKMHILFSEENTRYHSQTWNCCSSQCIDNRKVQMDFKGMGVVASRKLHKISIYSPTNAHTIIYEWHQAELEIYYLSHHSHIILWERSVMFIPHEMILKIFQVIYYCFHILHIHTQKRDTSWALLFAVACVHLNSWMPLPIFLEYHKYCMYTRINIAQQCNQKIEAKWKIFHRLVLLTTTANP